MADLPITPDGANATYDTEYTIENLEEAVASDQRKHIALADHLYYRTEPLDWWSARTGSGPEIQVLQAGSNLVDQRARDFIIPLLGYEYGVQFRFYCYELTHPATGAQLDTTIFRGDDPLTTQADTWTLDSLAEDTLYAYGTVIIDPSFIPSVSTVGKYSLVIRANLQATPGGSVKFTGARFDVLNRKVTR